MKITGGGAQAQATARDNPQRADRGRRGRIEQDFALYQSAIEVVRLTVADQSGHGTFTVPMNESFTVPMMAP